jgi:P4 family phage/plasmid primase-like protien
MKLPNNEQRCKATPKPSRPPTASAPEAPDDPHVLARHCIRALGRHADGPTLRRWSGSWWSWDGSRYVCVPDEEVHAQVNGCLKKEFTCLNAARRAVRKKPRKGKHNKPRLLRVTRNTVDNVLAALMTLDGVLVPPSRVNLLSWVGPESGKASGRYVAVANGLLNVDAVLRRAPRVLRRHTPNWFSPACLPYAYDAKATCPRWQRFLARNLEGDAERIALLQEWVGYCVVYDNTLQKFLMMVGEGSNGKSVVCAVLTALLGEDNISNVPLEDFGQRFALTQTLGKLLNIASEMDQLNNVAEARLKGFTSGDRMMFDRKGIAPVEAVPTARVVLCTNNLPKFKDRSEGIWRRLLLLPFRVEIPDGEKVRGMDTVAFWQDAGELPGILNWALEGLRRLLQSGRFTEPQLCREAVAQYRRENNDAARFLAEHCRKQDDSHVLKGDLYAHYRGWCARKSCEPLPDTEFGKEVVRAFRHLKGLPLRRFGVTGQRKPGYPDLAYRPEPQVPGAEDGDSMAE